MDAVAQSIKSLRNLEGLSQEQLADKVGVTRSAISMYESGSINPKMEVLEKLADVFGVSVASMMYMQDEEAYEFGVERLVIPSDEYELINCYRSLSAKYKTLLLETARAYRDSEKR